MENKIEELLKQPLDKSLVNTRDVSGRGVQYIEGHSAIRNANKIFGFDGWSDEVTRLEISPQGTNKNGNLVYSGMAIVKVTILGVTREDIGFGDGIAKLAPAAMESAGKQAVTDALKRTLRTFGDQFGNGLYDKRFDHTWIPDEDDDVVDKINAAKSVDELEKVYKSIPANEKSRYNATVVGAKKKLEDENNKKGNSDE